MKVFVFLSFLIACKIGKFTVLAQIGTLGFNLEHLPPFVYEESKKCSAADGCLRFLKHRGSTGTDTLGYYLQDTYLYATELQSLVEFSNRTYQSDQSVVVYKQRFPNGLVGANNIYAGKDGVSTGFPVFRIPNITEAPGLRFITPGGYHGGFTLYAQGGIQDLNRFRYGESGGIVVLAQQKSVYTDSIIMSALKESMSISVFLDKETYELSWGIQGQASIIPQGFEIEIIVKSDRYSINRNVKDWGRRVRTYHETSKINDFTIDYLGYWTDNGAAHYYNPTPYTNFEDALMSVYNHSKENGIPFRYVQLDSWWYYKGEGRGVKLWKAMPKIFPNGIESLHQKTGWPILAHNRYFSRDTDYALQNSGDYSFFIDNVNPKSLPLDKVFWDDLLDDGIEWGLYAYEQDWMDRTYEETRALHMNLTLGSYWLDTMGTSALQRQMPIQYCMAFPRHFLHTPTLPSVTQMRVSDDYLWIPDQWRIGVTSMFAYALGLKPYKDNHWTSRVNEDVVYVDCQLDLSTIPLLPEITILYGGRINHTASGKECLYWTEFGYDVRYPHSALRLNLCRNPDGIKDSAFCYTTASFDLDETNWEWEYCDIPTCVFDCHLFDGTGIFYLGKENVTESGTPCADWNGEFNLTGNMCRNPDDREAPWCYTNADHTEGEYCDTKCPELIEHNSNLQSAVSTLSTGPVGVGDRAEQLDKHIIMKTCRSDGMLLKPSKPLTAIDLRMLESELYEIWTSESVISSICFGIIFMVDITGRLKLTAYQLNLDFALSWDVIVFQNYPNPLSYVEIVEQGASVELPPLGCNNELEFCLYYTSPMFSIDGVNMSILGELDKWTPMSSQRFKELSTYPSLASIVDGLSGETIIISFWSSDKGIFNVTCDFSTDGEMIVDGETKTCVPYVEEEEEEDSAPIHPESLLLTILMISLNFIVKF